MIKRTIEISTTPAHVSIQHGQLLIRQRSTSEVASEPSVVLARIPVEDVGIVMVDQRDTTFSLSALAEIAEHGGALCVCSQDHLPTGMLLPLSSRHETVSRIRSQMNTGLPTKKRLWQQVVRAKILGQAKNLPSKSAVRSKLLVLRASVRSGDSTNVEAHAAKLYWGSWLGEGHDFRRAADGQPPNNLLNYGYAVLRAAVARAIVSAGLIPAIGIHHDNRSNEFCLADDLIEPLRPMVDRRVRELFLGGASDVERAAKESLLGLLTAPVRLSGSGDGSRGPLMVALHRYIASFVACLPKISHGMRLAIPSSVSTE
jgi:CRISPR-associated protein Cas1